MGLSSHHASWWWMLGKVLLTVAAVCYCTMLVEAAYGFPYDPLSSTLSEVAAKSEPSSTVARVVDLTSGVLMVGTAVVWWWVLPRLWVVRGAVGGLLLLGAGTVVSDLSPLPCAASLSESCARRVDRLSGSAVVWHAGASTVAAAGTLLITGAVWWLLRAAPVRGGVVVGRVAVWLVVVTSALLLVCTVWGVLDGDNGPLVGAWQRLNVIGQCVLLVLLPGSLARVLPLGSERHVWGQGRR